MRGVLAGEDWAEIRRLHRAGGLPIKAIARRLGVSRNAVRRAFALVAEQLHGGLTEAPAWPTLRAQLALLAVGGNDPIRVLRDAAAGRELDSAEDPAAVLDWRLDPAGGLRAGGPLPWLPAVPAALADNPTWGPYLTARAELVADCAGIVRDGAAVMTPTTAPPWATRLLAPDAARLRADLAVWRAATGTATHDRRPTGPPQLSAAAVRHQHRLEERRPP